MLTTQREPSSLLAVSSIRVQRLADQVTRALSQRVVTGALPVGATLPSEKQICAEYDVSKTVAREVVARLEAMGLVEVRHGRRTLVRPSSAWNHFDPTLLELRLEASAPRALVELQDLRLVLEPEIAARAAQNATAEQLATLRALLDEMRTCEDDGDAYLEHDAAFHLQLAEAAGNELFGYILDSIRELLRLSRRFVTDRWPESRRVSTDAHQEIYVAVEARDPGRARDAMRAHLVWAVQPLREAMGGGSDR